MAHYAFPCPCGHRACKNWLVSGVAAIQGVSFNEREARAVAGLLNFMNEKPQAATYTVTALLQYQNRS